MLAVESGFLSTRKFVAKVTWKIDAEKRCQKRYY